MTKIMVVDDEKDLREMINQMLEIEGYETNTAENGEDLLNKIDSYQPDLITLDIMMPGLTTKQILEKLTEKKIKSKIILLSVVRFSDEQKKQLFNMANVVDYITKPFEIKNLLNKIEHNIKK